MAFCTQKKGNMACKMICFTVAETEAQATLRGQLRLMKCSTDQPDSAQPPPFSVPSAPAPPTPPPEQLQTQPAQQVRSVGAASPPQLLLLLLQRDISFALSPAGKNIPDMQLSSQLTLAGSDPAEGHLPSPAAISAASKATPASRVG